MLEFLNGKVVLHGGDCRDVIRSLPDNSIDAIVCDPPYALVSIVKRYGSENAAPAIPKEGSAGVYSRSTRGFMGKQWDTGEAAFAAEFWAECLRVLKPGGHVAAFSGTRTYHRLACAIEDAGFEIRDQLAWTYGSGFPKSHNISKAIDKAAGAKREVVGKSKYAGRASNSGTQYEGFTGEDDRVITAPATDDAKRAEGWGTALKPAWEPIALARKALAVPDGNGGMRPATVAENFLHWGTGALFIDGCRIGTETLPAIEAGQARLGTFERNGMVTPERQGRYPANILHDGSEEVVECFPPAGGQQGKVSGLEPSAKTNNVYGAFNGRPAASPRGDSGTAARFFYSAKADGSDRVGSNHPTVKPVDLMQWLCRLLTPPGGTVLDPFAGTGTTGEAAFREGFKAVLIEREDEYQADIARRMKLALAGPDEKAREIVKAKGEDKPADNLPLFASR